LAVVTEVTELVFLADGIEVVAVDAGVVGQDAVESPLSVGNAVDQQFFAVADGAKAGEEIDTEAVESCRVFAGEEGVGAGESMFGGVAAGVGFSGVGLRSGGFLGVFAIGVHLSFGHGQYVLSLIG
jgi:hypothetical protein